MKPDTTEYLGRRVPSAKVPYAGVTVLVGRHELTPNHSQRVFNHSPDGFEWGYGGSGPSQLALAILLDFLEAKKKNDAATQEALHWKHEFKTHFVSRFEHGEWYLTGSQIRTWIEEHRRNHPFEPVSPEDFFG